MFLPPRKPLVGHGHSQAVFHVTLPNICLPLSSPGQVDLLSQAAEAVEEWKSRECLAEVGLSKGKASKAEAAVTSSREEQLQSVVCHD